MKNFLPDYQPLTKKFIYFLKNNYFLFDKLKFMFNFVMC